MGEQQDVKAQHTPGPWRVQWDAPRECAISLNRHYDVLDADGVRLGTIVDCRCPIRGRFYVDRAVDARLYDALTGARQSTWWPKLTEARAAIAAVEGK